MTSGSAANKPSHAIQSECAPASPNRLFPPAAAISSGIQLPPAISGSTHSMKATRGLPRDRAPIHLYRRLPDVIRVVQRMTITCGTVERPADLASDGPLVGIAQA